MTPLRRSWPWWRWALTGLSALALALSGFLGWHYVRGGAMIGCSGGNSCDQVLNSRWSSIAGLLPVSGLAAGVYLAMLVSSFFLGSATVAPVRRLAWHTMLVLAGAIAGSAVWFVIVQKWMIGAFCPYCMATHITGLLLATLVLWRAPKQVCEDSIDPALPKAGLRCVIRPLPAVGLAMIGLALAGAMAASQIAFTPPAVCRAGESQSDAPAIDTRTMPLVGATNAPYVITLLFDYKCPHCQKLHFMLDEAIRRYNGKLAFALCPTPLNRQCNPYIPRDVDEFKDSCELARIGLAVWVASPETFPTFNRWMFSLESGDFWRPRSVEAARAKAIESVGQAKFDTAMADPRIDQCLQSSIKLYGDTGGGAVPKLVYGSRWVIPEPNDSHDLVSILQESLALPGP